MMIGMRGTKGVLGEVVQTHFDNEVFELEVMALRSIYAQ
jgi:hypothetical protein